MLKPFFPGLEKPLADAAVSEVLIIGSENVWIEKNGRLRLHHAPELDQRALERAEIHIARPLGLNPKKENIVDARLADGSRVAICAPPASPDIAIHPPAWTTLCRGSFAGERLQHGKAALA